MIRAMDTFDSVVSTTIQGHTEETRPGKPDDVTQKHDITPYLKTDGNEIQQQNVDLSSRTVSDLKTPSRRPYYGSSESHKSIMDNSSIGHYYATYANLSDEFIPETVRIGDHKLMTLDPSQKFIDPDLAEEKSFLESFNFNYLVDFLKKNDKIKYIVDIGCGDGKISLLMQNHLRELGSQIKVIPVDVNNSCADTEYNDNKPIPFNLIPAQEIAGASPATTLFTAIHPFTELEFAADKLSREITQGKTDYYITTLIKNNPGCFVLATEDLYTSSPQRYIPPELVYTKHYHAYPICFRSPCSEPVSVRQERAEKMNSENGYISRLNQLLAKLPEQRDSYLASISEITDGIKEYMLEEPEEFWPDNIFKLHIDYALIKAAIKPFKPFESIQTELIENGLEMRCWHVYRQDINTSEVAGQAGKEP
ncbi:hypothetical protein [Endozoicomonas sp. 8E]|uniref:hypothetical protein n=1 Tax=Endozoicomonas sp. 8E TaxID=3035692 RepID=UPI0029391A83|nr:hypothetical protein [Endozoicomonas sp. 8E]WOG30036.1 hypothetical protein P6910_10390 [Endozoicomonas sp. 8E]